MLSTVGQNRTEPTEKVSSTALKGLNGYVALAVFSGFVAAV